MIIMPRQREPDWCSGDGVDHTTRLACIHESFHYGDGSYAVLRV